MKSTFLIEVETEGDTDLIGVAEELKNILDEHFEYDVSSVKPWQRPTMPGAAFAPPAPPSAV